MKSSNIGKNYIGLEQLKLFYGGLNKLYSKEIYTFEQLISLSDEELNSLFEDSFFVEDLKFRIHTLGYILKDEKLSEEDGLVLNNKKLFNIEISNLELPSKVIAMFHKYRSDCLGDMILMFRDLDWFNKIGEKRKNDIYTIIKSYNGIVFDDYIDLKLKNDLMKNGIYCDALFQEFKSLRNNFSCFDVNSLDECVLRYHKDDLPKDIINIIHALGYFLKGEDTSNLCKPKDFEKYDISCLNLCGCASRSLRRDGINTVGELILYDEKRLRGIYGIGNLYFDDIKNAVHAHGCLFVDEDPSLLDFRIKNTQRFQSKIEPILESSCIETGKQVNRNIQSRIEKKEELIDKFREIMIERQQLFARERELDRQLQELYDQVEQVGVSLVRK